MDESINYHVLHLLCIDNWVQEGEKLVFVHLVNGSYENYREQYPISILDVIRVVRDKLDSANLLVDSKLNYEKWMIAVSKNMWPRVREVIEQVFAHDFGSRLPVARLDALDWEYNPTRPDVFERNADYVEDADRIASDLSDWTGFNVKFRDTSIDKGYWQVSLPSDDERIRFANACEQYEQARARIAEAMINRVLLLTEEQYQRAKDAIEAVRWKRIFERNNVVLIAFDENTYTREIIKVLDAAGVESHQSLAQRTTYFGLGLS